MKYLAVSIRWSQRVDRDPIAVWQMVLRHCRDYVASKRPLGDETNLFIVVVTGAFVIDALEGVLLDVIFDQLGGYELVSIPGVQTTGYDLQKRRSLWSARVDDFGGN